LSKIPALVSEKNQLYSSRDKMTPIDIYKLQKLYKCQALTIPEVIKERDSIEEERVEKINKRFKLETRFNGISDALAEKYLEKTYETCGIDHFWPVDYPLVESTHRFYKLMCTRKKAPFGRCRFSVECNDEEAVCVRPFFKKRGFCTKFANEKLNNFSQEANDLMFHWGTKVKDTVRQVLTKQKN
jgi:hypothetical protein